jgi:hypothetical protein
LKQLGKEVQDRGRPARQVDNQFQAGDLTENEAAVHARFLGEVLYVGE